MQTPLDQVVAAALERLAEEQAQTARRSRETGDKDDAKFFQRAANAYAKALQYWLAGVRPTPTPNGYMLPSQRPGEPPHLLTMHGDWICTCAAGESMHWASALIIGLEVAHDDLERFDSVREAEIEPEPPSDWPRDDSGAPLDYYAAKEAVETGLTLGQRIAAARARLAA